MCACGGQHDRRLDVAGHVNGLRKVADRAKREPAPRFNSLAHLIDEQFLAEAYARLKSDAAVGVDGITKEQYGQDLQSKLRDLHRARLDWERFADLLDDLPLPNARIVVSIWR